MTSHGTFEHRYFTRYVFGGDTVRQAGTLLPTIFTTFFLVQRRLPRTFLQVFLYTGFWRQRFLPLTRWQTLFVAVFFLTTVPAAFVKRTRISLMPDGSGVIVPTMSVGASMVAMLEPFVKPSTSTRGAL